MRPERFAGRAGFAERAGFEGFEAFAGFETFAFFAAFALFAGFAERPGFAARADFETFAAFARFGARTGFSGISSRRDFDDAEDRDFFALRPALDARADLRVDPPARGRAGESSASTVDARVRGAPSNSPCGSPQRSRSDCTIRR
jgi:hypothetical protein